MAAATGATSRFIAIGIAGWFFLMAFSPKLAMLLMVLPKPVLGAALLYTACFILANGIEIITSRGLDLRRTTVVGLSLILAMSYHLGEHVFDSLPLALKPITASPISLGVMTAILLNIAVRFGVHRTASLSVKVRTGGDTRNR